MFCPSFIITVAFLMIKAFKSFCMGYWLRFFYIIVFGQMLLSSRMKITQSHYNCKVDWQNNAMHAAIPWAGLAGESLAGLGPSVCGPGKPGASILFWKSWSSFPAHWAWASMAPLWRSQWLHPSAGSVQGYRASLTPISWKCTVLQSQLDPHQLSIQCYRSVVYKQKRKQ